MPNAINGWLIVDGQKLVYGSQWTIKDPKEAKTIEVIGDACPQVKAAKHVEARFPWTSREVGFLFTFTGFLGILLQGGLIGRLVKKFGEPKLVLAGFIAACTAYIILGFAFTIMVVGLVAVISAFGNGVLRPVITSLITQVAGRKEQGIAIGISGSLSSFAMMLAPVTGGALLEHHHLQMWTLVPAAATAIGFIVALASRRPVPPS
jgi:MFS family permease